MNSRGHRDTNLLIWAIALIVIGLLLVFRNLGWLSFSVWPLFIIALGIVVLVKSLQSAGEGGPVAEVREYEYPLGGVESAVVSLENGLGDLRVGGPHGDDILIVGEFDTNACPYAKMQNGAARIYLPRWGEGFRFWQMFGNRRIWLTSRIPLSLRLSHWLGDIRADLESLQIHSLRISHGLGDVKITFPRQGKTQAIINVLGGDTTLYLPQGIAARVNAPPMILGTLKIDRNAFKYREGAYVTDDYEAAENRVNIRLGSHLGDIRIYRT